MKTNKAALLMETSFMLMRLSVGYQDDKISLVVSLATNSQYVIHVLDSSQQK